MPGIQHPTPSVTEINDGLCRCGCGESAPLAQQSSARFGWVRGQPVKYILGHDGHLARRGHTVDPETGCWNYHGFKRDGYAWTVKYEGRLVAAYVAAYLAAGKTIPPGYEIACVNPDHLEAVTTKVNVHRSTATKLTDAQVVEVRERVAGGERQSEVACHYKVSPSLIHLIVSGKHRA